jgi:hypothetical protein
MVVTAHDVLKRAQAMDFTRLVHTGIVWAHPQCNRRCICFCHAMPCHYWDVRPMVSESEIRRRMVEFVALLHAWLLSGVLSPDQVFPVLACQKPLRSHPICHCFYIQYPTACTRGVSRLSTRYLTIFHT